MVGDLYRPLGPARGCKGSSWPTGVRIQLFGAILTVALAGQLARAIMSLPDGIENILGFVPKSTFQCERDGYFGDIDNDCRIFHLCQKQVNANGRTVSLDDYLNSDKLSGQSLSLTHTHTLSLPLSLSTLIRSGDIGLMPAAIKLCSTSSR